MRATFLILVAIVKAAASRNFTNFTIISITTNECDNCPAGPIGPKGEMGKPGHQGVPGEPGDPGRVFYRGSDLQCGGGPCPSGVPGEKGDVGIQGIEGAPGVEGPRGLKGPSGDIGAPGRIGPPALATGDVMYLPYKPGDTVGQICYSFRKVCMVPGLRNGWRGWYREGQSGHMIYKNWMYFVTLSACPCKYDEPAAPQPTKPRDCVRLGECQSWE